MASVFSSTIQSSILSLLLSRLPLHPLDIPKQSSFTFKGSSGPSLHLTNLSLDIDKLQTQYIPPHTPINVHHAYVKDLKISISMTGIQILAYGITCVISPKATIEHDEFLDPSSSIILKSLDDPLEGLEGMVESVVGFVDAVSGANSFITSTSSNVSDNNGNKWGDEVDDDMTIDDEDPNKTTKTLKDILKNDSELANDIQKNLNDNDLKSSNSLLSYAIDYLMGKVHVSLEDIDIRIIADPIESIVRVNKIESDGSKTERKCSIEGISVSVVKPDMNNNNKETENNYYEDNSTKRNTENQQGDDLINKTVHNVNDNAKYNDSDYDDEIMASSFMAESKDDIHQSIIESAMYTASGKSIYMSATQGDFFDAPTHQTESTVGDNKNDSIDTVLLTVDIVKLSLKKREDLTIEIGKIKVSLIPVPILSVSFLEFLIQVSKKKNIPKPKMKKDKPKSSSNIVLQQFSILDLHISLNSHLSILGTYEREYSDVFHCGNFLLEQKSPTLIQGNLQTFEFMTSNNEKCIYFENSQMSHPNIGFELQIEGNTHVSSVIANECLNLKVDFSLIESLLDFYVDIKPAVEKLEELRLVRIKKPKYVKTNESLRISVKSQNNALNSNNTKSEVTVKFNGLCGSIGLSNNPSDFITISISPVLYDTWKKMATVNSIKVSLNTDIGDAIVQVDNFKYLDYGDALVKFKIYDVISQKDILFNTKQTATVDNIDMHSSYGVINRISQIFGGFLSKIKPESKKVSKVQFENVLNNNSGAGSSNMFKSKIINYFGLIKQITYSISKINNDFGGISGEINNFSVTSLSKGTHQVSISEIIANRIFNNISEVIISKGNKWGAAPMIFAKIEKSYHIFFNNWLANYSGRWLAMFEKDVGENKYNPPIILSPYNNRDSTTIKKRFKKRSVVEIFVSLTDVSIGLKPVNLQSEAILLINKANSDIVIYNDKTIVAQLASNIISLFLIDDLKNIDDSKTKKNVTDWTMQSFWKNKGYAHIGSLNTVVTKIKINTIESIRNIAGVNDSAELYVTRALVDAQFDVEKVNFDLCCDSTQCFLQLIKDLKKPVYFSYDDKYKDTSESLNVFDDVEFNFFDTLNTPKNSNVTKISDNLPLVESLFTDTKKDELSIVENFYDNIKNHVYISNSTDSSNSNRNANSGEISLNSSHFDNINNSLNNKIIPLSLHLNITEAGIALHDGYDWKETRTQIRRALKRVSEKAKFIGNQTRNNQEDYEEVTTDSPNDNQETEIVEETLYQSIMLGVGPDDDTNEIYAQITENISGYKKNLNVDQDEHAKTIDLGKNKANPLRLKRSVKNKVLIKFDEIDVNFKLLSVNEPHLKKKPIYFSENDEDDVDDSEIVNRIEVGIQNLAIIDNVPTSSWNLFAGYMREAGEREIGKGMIKINVDLVRPVAKLAAIEMILHVSILPLRLYVDQDTLDFVTRFCEFKDQRFIPQTLENEEMFIEKISVDKVIIKLDYKPKKLDYAGIRSGHTSEFINIFILDGSEITLNKVTLYGVPGFSKLNTLLNGFWSPDVKRNQLAGVLSGLAPVRSIINIGSGVNNLVTVPMKEYKKDGRIVRSLQVGAIAFTKVTSGEILKLGAKLAAGTQTILENTEEAFGGSGSSARIVKDLSVDNSWKDSKRKTNGNRRRSSTASFGDEEESDYHRYYFQGKKNMINNGKEDSESNIINESAIDYTEYDEDAISDSESDSEFGKTNFHDINTEKNEHDGRKIESETYVVSLYSDQPASFNEGLKTAYNSIQRNFSTAKNALYEASIKASESENASTALYELAKATPVVFLRPAIAATEAISKSLLGGVNDINPDEKRKAEEKYKKLKYDNDDNYDSK
ncbi:autophagy- protein 2 [Pichia californica]|nr:autophagy- protein 2 [[Candida] californica]